ncbi:Alternate F1F0 ATPase, F1 subunit gamma [uncultured Desulfatiglans sp.]|nr:Alternate F1F0 ATPase, F1 subunit gamma [uncultured Desulfatiglans sp.]
MQTLENLNRKITTAQDLLAVVQTMKSLAAVNIRQYERAAETMDAFRDVVDMGWQIFLRGGTAVPSVSRARRAVCLVVGSDQGMCGQFNEVIVRHALERIEHLESAGFEVSCWSAGEKVVGGLEDAGRKDEASFRLPGSLPAIIHTVQEIIQRLDERRRERGAAFFHVCHNVLAPGAYAPSFHRLLPLDAEWARAYRERRWPNRSIPMLGASRENMFTGLFHQYLFVSIYRVFAQSLAAENAGRLTAMQAAEKNILEMEDELQALYREQRQAQITNELIDIISGFEALREDEQPV